MSVKCEVIDNKDGTHRVQTSVDGGGVSWLTIIDLEMHYGASRIYVWGIAGGIHVERVQGKGYSRKTINHALDWMRSHGYTLAALFGIPEYYHRYGFETFMGEHHVRISLRSLSKIEALNGSNVNLHDDPSYKSKEVARLYEKANVDRIASRVRDPNLWNGFRKGVSWEHKPRVLVAEEHDRVVGYAVVERWPDHPLVDLLKAYGCRFESRYPWKGDGMAKVVNLKLLLSIHREGA